MDSTRIKQVSPSVARLNYEANRKNQNKGKKEKKRINKNTQEPPADNGNVIDDFA